MRFYNLAALTLLGALMLPPTAQAKHPPAANIQKQIPALHPHEKKIEAIDPSALDASIAADRLILLNNIRSQLLTLETIRPWEKNPDIYSGSMSNAAFSLMERKFASPDDRLRSVI